MGNLNKVSIPGSVTCLIFLKKDTILAPNVAFLWTWPPLLGSVKWIDWKYFEEHHQHSEYQAAHQRKRKKIACSITLRNITARIILCTDRIMLQRKDVTKGISFWGTQLARFIFLQTTVHKVQLVSRFLKLGVAGAHHDTKEIKGYFV